MEEIKTKQRMKRESFYLYKLRIENRVIQKASGDSVNGVYCVLKDKSKVWGDF